VRSSTGSALASVIGWAEVKNFFYGLSSLNDFCWARIQILVVTQTKNAPLCLLSHEFGQGADLGGTTTMHLTLAAGLAVAKLVEREVELYPEK